MFKKLERSCRNATAITGITPEIMSWGLKYADRKKTEWDIDFPLAYPAATPDEGDINEAIGFWEQFGLKKNSDDFNVCFFGTMGRQFEMETVINAANILSKKNISCRFVLCGTGDNIELYKKLAIGTRNIIFPGWVNAESIWTLMRMSSIALAPYRSSKDFVSSIPNKVIEYLSAGLPIISSLKGVLKNLLDEYGCGLTYDNENAAQLASTIEICLQDPERLKKMAENAERLYNRCFVAENVYNNMTEYLEKLARNKIEDMQMTFQSVR